MFEIYRLVCYKDVFSFCRYSFDLLELMTSIHTLDSWFIEKCEIIEGLYYPMKVIARSSNVVLRYFEKGIPAVK